MFFPVMAFPLGRALRHHARHQRGEVHDVAAVHGQFFDGPGVDHLAQVGVFGLQQRRGGLDFDALGHFADLHRNVRADRAGNSHFDILRVAFLKPLCSTSTRYIAGNEVEKLVVASRAGQRLMPFAGSGIGQGDGRAMHGRLD